MNRNSQSDAASTSDVNESSPITNNNLKRPSISNQTSNSDLSSIHSVQSNSTSNSNSSSAWRINLELSLPTQRRLIRKPLPNLPGQNPIHSSSSGNNSDLDGMNDRNKDDTVARKLRLDAEKVEAWWPDVSEIQIRDHSQGRQSDGDDIVDDGIRNIQTESESLLGLDVNSEKIFEALLLYNLALPPTSISNQHSFNPPFGFHSTLSNSLNDCIDYFSNPSILESLQRTLSIQWRAETQLRSSNLQDGIGSDPLSITHVGPGGLVGAAISSRWAKLGWPATALSRGYALTSGSTSTSNEHGTLNATGGPSSSSTLRNHDDLEFGDENESSSNNKIRKRDVAIKILTNAVWLAKTYGSPSIIYSNYQDQNPKSKDETIQETSQLSSSTSSNLTPTPTPRKREKGKAPNFIRLPAATTALTSTTQDSDSTNVSASNSTSTSAEASKPTSIKDGTTSSSSSTVETSGDTRSTASNVTSSIPSRTNSPAPSSTSTSNNTSLNSTSQEKPASTSQQPSSKAVERLASLNAAAGAALAAQAKQYAESHPGEDVDPTQFSTSSSRPRSVSSVSSLSHTSLHSQKSLPKGPIEAQKKETEAIRKAEEKHLKRLEREFEAWSRMVITRICLEFLDDDEEIPPEVEEEEMKFDSDEEDEGDEAKIDENGRRRSGTVTATNFARDALSSLTFNSSSKGKNEEGEEGGDTIKGRKIPTYPSSSKFSNNSKASSSSSQSQANTKASEDRDSIFVWRKNVWRGEFLFNQSPPPSGGSEDAKRLRVVGGTFFVRRVKADEVKEWVKQIIETMVSCSRLQSGFVYSFS